MSEDRSKFDRSSDKPAGHKTGNRDVTRRGVARDAESKGRPIIGQSIPDKVRREVEGKGKANGKGGKRR